MTRGKIAPQKVILILTAISNMNVFFSIALALGLAVFPAVYIYRLYVPLEEVKQ
mgnify:CR=1 FL=1